MKTILVAVASLALASCGQRADDTAEPNPSPTVSTATATAAAQTPTGTTAGRYEISTPDGMKISSTLNPDGTYLDVANGEEERGSWRMKGVETCFDPAGEGAERCYTTSAPAADGSMQVTGADGRTATLRRVDEAPAR